MSSNQLETKGFFAALFDFSFTSFITLRFLRVIYAVLVGLILLGGLFFLFAFLSQGGASGVILGLVGAPLITLLYLVMARIYLELVALFFRIGENTSVMARAMSAQPGGPGSPGAPAGYGPFGSGGPYGAGPGAAPYGGAPAASPYAAPGGGGATAYGEPSSAERPYGDPEPPPAQER